MYSGEKKLPKSKNAVWQGWFNSLSNNEHQFLKLLIELFFQKGVNDLIWDEVIKHKFQRNPLANDADPFTFIVIDMSGSGMSTHMLRIDSEKII